MLSIVIGFLIGTALIATPSFVPLIGSRTVSRNAMRILGGIVMLAAVASTSFVYVGDGKLAQLFRVYGGNSLAEGKIVAMNGENGPQARILRPGFHFSLLVNVLYNVDTSKKETEIPNGKLGVLVAKDGVALRPGQAFADPFPVATGAAMLDAETFLKKGGQRGPQLTVLLPGKYPLNDYLWAVDIRDAKDIPLGFVGVVKSNVWAEIDFGTLHARKPENCEVVAQKENDGRLEAPIVSVGCVGVWRQSLQPGKYYFNPDAFTVTEIDTRVQVWTYAGGYDRCQISLEVDSKGEIAQKRDCRPVEINSDNADRAVFVKMEGWDIPLELRALAQVSPENAACVVAGVGTLKQVEDRVLTPSIRAITRDVAGGTYKVTEVKTDENGRPMLGEDGKPLIHTIERPTKALDLINQRPLIEGEIERRIQPEAAKSCVIIREVRLGEPAIPPELLVAVRREQLATQLAKAYVQEQIAQSQRIAAEKAKQTANQQETLVKAEIGVLASVQNAQALRNEGQGERDKLAQIAEGQKKQMDVIGPDNTVRLRQFELLLSSVMGFFKDHPEVLTSALTNSAKFVPQVQVAASGESGLGGLLTGLVGNTMLSGLGSSAPPAPQLRGAVAPADHR